MEKLEAKDGATVFDGTEMSPETKFIQTAIKVIGNYCYDEITRSSLIRTKIKVGDYLEARCKTIVDNLTSKYGTRNPYELL